MTASVRALLWPRRVGVEAWASRSSDRMRRAAAAAMAAVGAGASSAWLAWWCTDPTGLGIGWIIIVAEMVGVIRVP